MIHCSSHYLHSNNLVIGNTHNFWSIRNLKLQSSSGQCFLKIFPLKVSSFFKWMPYMPHQVNNIYDKYAIMPRNNFMKNGIDDEVHGLNQADIVFESLIENQYTRFMAIFDSNQNIPLIGLIRSTRPHFIYWSLGFSNCLLIHCGGTEDANKILSGCDNLLTYIIHTYGSLNSQFETTYQLKEGAKYFFARRKILHKKMTPAFILDIALTLKKRWRNKNRLAKSFSSRLFRLLLSKKGLDGAAKIYTSNDRLNQYFNAINKHALIDKRQAVKNPHSDALHPHFISMPNRIQSHCERHTNQVIKQLTIQYNAYYIVKFIYNPNNSLYERYHCFKSEEKHYNTKIIATFDSLIILFTKQFVISKCNHYNQFAGSKRKSDIYHKHNRYCYRHSVVTTGSGDALLLNNGVLTKHQWVWKNIHSPLVLKDMHNKSVPIKKIQ